jgi:hypothetical protein
MFYCHFSACELSFWLPWLPLSFVNYSAEMLHFNFLVSLIYLPEAHTSCLTECVSFVKPSTFLVYAPYLGLFSSTRAHPRGGGCRAAVPPQTHPKPKFKEQIL